MNSSPSPISFRPIEQVSNIISKEIESSNYQDTVSTVVQRLILRAAGMPQPVYVVSGISRLREIEALIMEIRAVLRALDEVTSRLGGPLNPKVYEDGERKKNVMKWRAMSEELPPKLEALVTQIALVTELMLTGWTKEEYEAMRKLQILVRGTLKSPSSDGPTKVYYQRISDALAKFLGPSSAD